MSLNRFGNGQFACLILCLTVSDLLTVSCGLLGGLILEVGFEERWMFSLMKATRANLAAAKVVVIVKWLCV